jgi:hypothetical protein
MEAALSIRARRIDSEGPNGSCAMSISSVALVSLWCQIYVCFLKL